MKSRKTFKEIAAEIGELVTAKNLAYGDAGARSPEILRVLFPDGVDPLQYEDLLLLIRVIDKLFRIANRKNAFGENPWRDIAGYGVLAATIQQEQEQEQEEQNQNESPVDVDEIFIEPMEPGDFLSDSLEFTPVEKDPPWEMVSHSHRVKAHPTVEKDVLPEHLEFKPWEGDELRESAEYDLRCVKDGGCRIADAGLVGGSDCDGCIYLRGANGERFERR